MTSPPEGRSGPTVTQDRPETNPSDTDGTSQYRPSTGATWQRTAPPGVPLRPKRLRSTAPMVSTLAQMGFFRNGTPAQRRRLVDAIVEERQRCELRRTRVLAHPDLAERLVTDLGYRSPHQWNGYVPPRSDAENPRREALMAILYAVIDRETGAETCGDVTTSSLRRLELVGA